MRCWCNTAEPGFGRLRAGAYVVDSGERRDAVRCLALFVAVAALAQQPPTRVLVSYDSQSGNTEKLAQAIQKGAASVEGAEVTLKKTADVRDEDILRSDGILLGTPIHWSNVSAEAKRFLDHVGAVLSKSKTIGEGRTAGTFCTGGGVSMGKDIARLSVLSAFMTMRFLVIGGIDADGYGTLGPQATTGSADPGMSQKELEEGRQFGERFARLTQRMRASR
jgi:NAD(P)H dehydrogenase (quinone)